MTNVRSMMRTYLSVAVVTLVLTAAPSRATARVAPSTRIRSHATAPYTIRNLNATVGGGTARFVPTALNNLGQIAGYDSAIVIANGSERAGAAYVIDADGTVHVLQNTGISTESYIPLAISSSGRSVAAEGTTFDQTGPDTWIRSAAGSYGLRYRRFNGNVPITGLTNGDLAVGGPNYYGVANYTVGSFQTGGCALGGFFANDVDDAGTIVGTAAGYAAEDTLTGCGAYVPSIPRPKNVSTSAIAINARGTLLGSVVGPAAPAFGSYYILAGGHLTRLPLPTGYLSTAYYLTAVALSDDDTIVGNVVGQAPPFTPVAPFVYQNGRSIDVNTLLPANSGWRLVTASAVNASGEIVGTGFYGGVLTGYALVP